jgi:peptide-methionine (S)-S-oxide reductase
MKERIVFGGGCFWCTEAVFEMMKGVESTTPGYAGGTKKNPTYQEVCTGDTGHAEVLEIEYDSDEVPLGVLLEIFFEMHDPTSLNRQGNDVGNQYRSIILYTTEAQRAEAERAIREAQKMHDKPVVTELRKLDKFYPAEDYHKNYYDKNPLQPYCLLVTRPKVDKIKKKFGKFLKK